MLTLTTCLIVALTLNNSNVQDTTSTHGKQLAIIPTKALQKYDEKSSYEFYARNKAYCEKLRDSMYEDSRYLEQRQDRLPNDFLLMSQKTAVENISSALTNFEKNDCYENPFLPSIDRDLLRKLSSDLKK